MFQTQNASTAWLFHRSLKVLFLIVLILWSATYLRAMDLSSAKFELPVETLPLNSTLRYKFDDHSTRASFQILVPAAGILAVTVTSPADSTGSPRIGPAKTGTFSTAHLEKISRKTAGWIIKTDRATLVHFDIHRNGSETSLNPYKIRNAFAPSSEFDGPSMDLPGDPPAICNSEVDPTFNLDENDSGTTSTGDDTIDPWDCDVMSGLVAGGGVLEITAEGAPLEIGVFEKDCSVPLQQAALSSSADRLLLPTFGGKHLFTVDSFKGSSGPYSIRYEHYPLCAKGEQDDHGDIPDCATPIDEGTPINAALGNPHGDDRDYFVLHLETPIGLGLRVDSPEQVLCRLENMRGHVLAPWRTCNGKNRFEQVFTEGKLLIAVTSTNSDLPYSLQVYRSDDVD